MYTPLHLVPPSVPGLIGAIENKYKINASNIRCNMVWVVSILIILLLRKQFTEYQALFGDNLKKYQIQHGYCTMRYSKYSVQYSN